jgi:hypothetical protein
VAVPESTKRAVLLTEDKEANPDRHDDQTDRPENNADRHNVPALQVLNTRQ